MTPQQPCTCLSAAATPAGSLGFAGQCLPLLLLLLLLLLPPLLL
jgi:hypothetical protein